MSAKRLRLAAIAALLLRIGPLPAFAQVKFTPADTAQPGTVPNGILYQGRLEDGGVPVTGNRNMIFRLFDTATGGNFLFASNNNQPFSVKMVGGVFGVVLDIPLGALVGSSQKFIEVQIDSTVLVPRDPLQTVPYAKVAESVEGTLDISTGGFTVSNAGGTILLVSSITALVGIGTSSPNSRLTISSTVAGGVAQGLEMANPSTTAGTGQRLVFNFNPAGTLETFGAIEAVRETVGGDTHLGLYTRAAAAPGERVRIDKDGNVGIGTLAPAAGLHVVGSAVPAVILEHATQPQLRLLRAGTTVLYADHDGTLGRIGTATVSTMTFVTNNAEAVRIKPDGNVGIGTADPLRKLDVAGTFRAAGVIETTSLGSAGAPAVIVGGDANTGLFQTAGDELRFATGGSERLRLNAGGLTLASPGDLTIGNASGAGADPGKSDLLIEGNLSVDNQLVVTGSSRFDRLSIATATIDAITTQLFKVGAGTVTVLESGRVGIGLTNPSADLHLVGTGQPALMIEHATTPELELRRAGAVRLELLHDGTDARINAPGTDFVMETAGTERLRIRSTGQVGISTPIPTAQLGVAGDLSVSGALNVGTTLGIGSGGTGATTSGAARTALDVPQRDGTDAVVTSTWSISISNTAAFATQLVADPANCPGSDFPRGVDASGVAQGCTNILGNQEPTVEGLIYDGDNHLPSINQGSWIVGASGAFDIAFDTNSASDATFYVDSSADRIGIGTTAPSAKLDVQGGDINASGVVRESGNAIMPAGMTLFFTGTSCPTGWSELTTARGRYLLARPVSGSTGTVVGTALSNGENRAVGQHNHTFTGNAVAAHNHTFTGIALGNHSHTFTGSAVAAHAHSFTGSALAGHNHTFSGSALGTHNHTVTDLGHSHSIGTATDIVDNGTTRRTVGPDTGATSSVNTTGVTVDNVSAGTPSGTISSDGAGTPSGTIGSNGGHTPSGTISSDGGGTPSGTVNNDAGHTPSGTISNTGTAGTNAPFIQLLLCVRS